jgi:uncharacterized membrane protein YidH (DUF202 family)
MLDVDTYVNGVRGLTIKLIDKMPDMIVAALTLVAALTWNDAARGIINYYTPDNWKQSGQKNPWVQVVYAVVLTVIITVIVTALIFSQSQVEKIFV